MNPIRQIENLRVCMRVNHKRDLRKASVPKFTISVPKMFLTMYFDYVL